jgi:S-adenosylmethionine-diacylglycerol 3-amino-3-carboxypropyl transferase
MCIREPIAFTITNEDHLVVERALRVTPNSRIVCIGSAGDTPLNLLSLDPDRVTAVDCSFGQTCLQWLKAAGVRHLEPRDLHVLLGVVMDPDGALARYRLVRAGMPARVRAFWDRRPRLIAGGVLWQGSMMRLLSAARLALDLCVGREGMRALQRCATPGQAELFFRRYVDRRRTRLLLKLFFNRWSLRLAHPVGGGLALAGGQTFSEMVLAGARRALTSHPVTDNPYLYPFLFGRYPSRGGLPPYLDRRKSTAVRRRLDQLMIVHADLLSYLATTADRSVDCFALSNIVDWLPRQGIEALLAQVSRVARPGARILLFSRSDGGVVIPTELRERLAPNRELGELLLADDRTGYHRSVMILETPSA